MFKKVFNENGRNIFDTLSAMERRVDNILFRGLFASSVFRARQLISTGGVLVNGKPVDRPSFQVSDGDIVQIEPSKAVCAYLVSSHPMIRAWAFCPVYLEVNYATLSIVFLRKPTFVEIPNPFPKYMIDNTGAYYSKRG